MKSIKEFLSTNNRFQNSVFKSTNTKEKYSENKKTKKRFLPIISITLSTLLLSFSGELKAENTPDVLIDGTYSESIKVHNGDNVTTNITLKGGSTWSGKLSAEAGIANVVMDNATWNGKTSTNTITAANNGNDQQVLVGLSYYQSIPSIMKITANNDSKVIGDITTPTANILSSTTNTLSFTNSSLTGDIKQPLDTNWNSKVAPHHPSTTATFSGNNSTDGYAWSGNLSNSANTTSVTLSDGAIWKGNATLSSTSQKDPTTGVQASQAIGNITLNSGSKQSGTISTSGTAELNLIASDASSVDTINAKGKNAIVTANGSSSINIINHNGGSGNYTLNSSSTLKNYNSATNGATLTLNDKSVVNNINITAGAANINVNSDSSVGADSTVDSISVASAATLNANFDNASVHIKGISGSNANSNIVFKNLHNSEIGNVDFAGSLVGNILSSSIGTLKNTNAKSDLTISDTQGQSYGDINYSAGNLKADFDFTPQVDEDGADSKMATIGDITLGAGVNAHLSLNFGGQDSSTNKIIGKQSHTDTTGSRDVKISGGSDNSSYSFSNIGTLSLESSSEGKQTDVATAIAAQTGVLIDNLKGTLDFQKTNIVLNKAASSSDTQPNVNSAFSLGSSVTNPTAGMDAGNSSFKILSATFGNAIFGSDGTTLITSNPTETGSTDFYTLTQDGLAADDSVFLKGKSSNGNIGYNNDGIEKHISFIFTDGTFTSSQSGYTGTIAGGTDNSTYLFYNAGVINTSQILNYLGTINLHNTAISGILGQSVAGADGTSTPKNVNISLDYSGESALPYGLGIVGSGKHNVIFNFTGNHNDVKFGGTLLGGTTTKIAGSNNTDNEIIIYGLEGIAEKKGELDESPNSLMGILHNAGLQGFNQTTGIKDETSTEQKFTDTDSKTHISDYGKVGEADKAEIAKGTTFKFLNTDFNAKIIEKDYAINLTFASTDFANVANEKDAKGDSESLISNPNKLIPLRASSFGSNLIDLSDNIYDNTLSFFGAGSISNESNFLNITLGTGKNSITALDTGVTLVLTGAGDTKDGSTLTLSNTSLIGDWLLGGTFSFGNYATLNPDGTPDTSGKTMQSSFYGKLSNTASTALSVSLNQGGIKSSTDGSVVSQYEGSLKSKEGTFDIPTISFANTDNSKNKLVLDNPGGILKIDGLSSAINLSNDSTLVANNTSIIGDIYGKTLTVKSGTYSAGGQLLVNLAFDSTSNNPTYYQAGSTDTITGLKDGSSVSFVGKGAFRTSKYNNDDKSDTGTLRLNVGVNSESMNVSALNTGGSIELYQSVADSLSGKSKGNYSFKGVNISTTAEGISSGNTGTQINMTFAKASSANETDLLSTKDGSLLTSSNDQNINDYIESSALKTAGTINIGSNATFNFIGDESFSTTTKTVIALSATGQATFNFINTGNMLLTDTSNVSSTSNNNAKILFASSVIPKSISNKTGDANYSYNIIGSSIGDALVSAPKDAASTQAQVKFTAIFDNNELSNRDEYLRYYDNKDIIGNSQLQIAKSSLSGTLTLGDNADERTRITANLTFYGKDALGANAKIIGANKNSIFTFNDTNVNFGANKTSSTFNVAGNVIFNNITATGFFSSVGAGSFSTKGVQSSAGQKNSTDNVLAFIDNGSSQDLSNIGGLDYSSVKSGGSFKGTLATTTSAIYTFVGQNSQGFNVAPIKDTTDSTKISNSANITKLDASLTNAKINIIDGGKLISANLQGTQAGSKNTLNLYGNTALSMNSTTEGGTPDLAINSAGLTINATIDSSNYALWNGSEDDDGNISTNFNISDPNEGTTANYNFIFNGNYGSLDYSHQFYKGTIGTLNSSSSFTFNNAGYLFDSQIKDTQAHIVLNETVMKGDLSTNVITLDFRPNDSYQDGLEALTGNIVKKYATPAQVKNITFDFTGNKIADKVKNTSDKSDGNYYVAGDSGSKFSFINLENNTSQGDAPQTDTYITWEDSTNKSDGTPDSDAVFKTLQKSGVHLREAKSTTTTPTDGKASSVSGDVYSQIAQTLDKNTTFNFYGSSIVASNADGSISSSYSLGFIFDSRDDNRSQVGSLNSTLNNSSFFGKSISSDQNLDIALYGANAFQNEGNILALQAGSGKTLNINAQANDGAMGTINVKNTSAVGAGSSMNLNGVGFEGTYLTSRDVSDPKNPKGGSITANFAYDSKLMDSSVLGTKDGSLNIVMDYEEPDDPIASTPKDTTKAPTLIIGTGKTTLKFNNAGAIKIKSSNKSIATWDANSEGTKFANGSSITSSYTSIIGDIYGTTTGAKNSIVGTLLADLTFDAADASNASFYQGGSTDTITGLRSGSKLSFSGKGALRSSKYDATTGVDSGSVNLILNSYYDNSSLNLNVSNTGGTLNLSQNSENVKNIGSQGNYNLKGVNLNLQNKINFSDASVNMIFANADTKNQVFLLTTSDGSLLTSSSENMNDYVESSTFTTAGSLIFETQNKNSYNNFTFIGDKSLSTTSKTIFQVGGNNSDIAININLINTGDMLKTDTSKLTIAGTDTSPNTVSDTLASIVFGSNLATEDGTTRYSYHLIGTSLANATVSANDFSGSNVSFNAIFDTRDLADRVDANGNPLSNLQYYTDGSIGNSQLQIAKSALSGTLNLAGKVTTNLAFYGKDALTSTAKIIGGNTNSNLLIDGSGSYSGTADSRTAESAAFNFASIKGFKGNANVINSTLASDLEDKAGVTFKDGKAVGSSVADESNLKSFQITFNANEDDLKAGATAEKIENTSATPADVTYSDSLSADANNFIKNSIVAKATDNNNNPLNVDFKYTHAIDKAIGYTKSALSVNFIGHNSIGTTGYKQDDTDKGKYIKNIVSGSQQGFYIHDDNANNVYNFIDFGELDTSLISDAGRINGTIRWIGNTYEIGTIYGAREVSIDFDNLSNAAIANNVYVARDGVQNIVFDFGGSTKKEDGSYKMGGYIAQGDKTSESTYTFSHLGEIDISKVNTASTGSTGTKDFLDVLNTTINDSATSKPIQVQSGTIGIEGTSIIGVIDWSNQTLTDGSSSSAILKISFSDENQLNGSIEGNGTKDVLFDGAKSLNKDAGSPSEVGVSPAPTTIKGGDDKSQYSFNNVGVIDQKTLNNLINGGNDDTDLKGKSSNSGSFSFDGDSTIVANIEDATDTTNIATQNILLGKNSDKGIEIQGKISTSAKVDVKFGKGSKVSIENKNENSQYDFSALAGNDPIIASINMDSNGTDGIKKAKVLGFENGNVSLIGSINDSNDATMPKDGVTPVANVYTFGQKSTEDGKNDTSYWLITGDSKVATLQAYNHSADQRDATLAANTLSNVGSVIDLRGGHRGTNDSSISINSAILAGAVGTIDGSDAKFTPVSLTAQKADLNNAVIRLGVDTSSSQADHLIIESLGGDEKVASSSSNILQVFLNNGQLDVSKPILLAQVSDATQKINQNFFSAAGYTQGLYNINPILKVSTATTSTPLAPTPDAGTDVNPGSDTSTPAPDAGANPTPDTSTNADATPVDPAPGNDALAPAPTPAPASGSDTGKDAPKAPTDTVAAAALASAAASPTTPIASKALNQCVGGENTLCYYLNGFNASVNQDSINTLEGTLGTFYRDFRIATNNLNLRMGELRNNEASQGVWARVINGMGSDNQNNKDFYVTFQAGYDYQFDVAGGVNYLGVDVEASMISSKGDAYTSSGRNIGVGIYNTYIMDNGFYVDASAKYLNLGNKISIKDSPIISDTSSDLTTNAYLFGAEIGYRYRLDNLMKRMQGYYIEPQAEVIYGYIGGASYDLAQASQKVTAALDANNALISRVGAVLGKNFKYSNGMLMDVRLGLSYINELNTGGDSTFTQTGSTLDLPAIHNSTAMNNKLNLSLGTNVRFNDNWRMYADISRTFLGVYNFDYNLNVGARWSFGNKISNLEKQKLQENKAQKADKNTQEATEKAKLIEEKKIIHLNTNGAKVGCQGCLPEKGLYLQVAVLAKQDANIIKEISKNSYRTYEFEMTKDKKTQKVTSYLIGPFKNIQEVYKNKALADSLMQYIYQNKNVHPTMYEVK